MSAPSLALLPNSVFAVRFAHPNTFDTSQTREMLADLRLIKFRRRNYEGANHQVATSR